MSYAYACHLHILNLCSPVLAADNKAGIGTVSETRPGGVTMRTVSIFKNGNNRAIRLPRDMDFEGISELEIVRNGDSIILRPVRPTWGSFATLEKADPDFMAEREDVVTDEGRFDL